MPTGDKGKYEKLRKAAAGESCLRCGVSNDTTVLCHYVGPRRHDYGGGMGHKGHDAIGAHLCADCHRFMDVQSRTETDVWLHSEEFLHLCALTLIRLFERGVIK